MSTETPDAETADQMRQQIRVIVREIETIARAEIPPTEFYEGFLGRVVSAMAAEGGAVWTIGEGNRLELAYQINIRATGLADDPKAQEQHGRLLRKVVEQGQGTLAPPHSHNPDLDLGNPTEFLIVASALRNEQEAVGVVEIFHRPGNLPNVERGYLRFLLQMCDVANDYLKTHRLRQFSSRQAMWSQLAQFTRLVHRDLDPNETAYTIANEGRRLIECDRVSVAVKSGSRYRLKAISGQEGFDKRSNMVAHLERLIAVVCRGGEPLWYSGESSNLPPQIEEAVEAYVDESHVKYLAVLPLIHGVAEETAENPRDRKREKILGALVVEQIGEDFLDDPTQRRVETVREHSTLALANAMEHDGLFLMPLWRALGKTRAVVTWRNLPKFLGVLGIILGILIALFLVPAELTLESRGTLEPVDRREIFADQAGLITHLEPIEQGQPVKRDQVLAVMTSKELEAEISAVNGEIDSSNETVRSINNSLRLTGITPVERVQLNGKRAMTQAQISSLRDKLQILEYRKQQLIVRSPIDGILTTWNTRDKLILRPVERGQKLLSVADDKGEWQLELEMPEEHIGHILAARRELKKQKPEEDLAVSFILATQPGRELRGRIREIHSIAEVQGEEGNKVLIKVAVDRNEFTKADIRDLRAGANVTAKVHCGKTSLGYAWFHDVIAFVQSRVLFKFW